MRLRRVSLALVATALAAPPVFGWWLMRRDSEAMAARGFVCGNPLLGDLGIALLLAAVLSLGAVVVGAVAYWRLPAPRPRARGFEMLALALPLLVAVGLVAAMSLM